MSEVSLLVLGFRGVLVEVRLIAGSTDEVNIYIFDLLAGSKKCTPVQQKRPAGFFQQGALN